MPVAQLHLALPLVVAGKSLSTNHDVVGSSDAFSGSEQPENTLHSVELHRYSATMLMGAQVAEKFAKHSPTLDSGTKTTTYSPIPTDR